MRRRRRFASLVVTIAGALVLAAACTDSPRASRSDGEPQDGRAAVSGIIDGFFADDHTGSYDDVRTVLIYQRDRPLVRRYLDSAPRETRDIASVTKSIMSILIGIAIDDGELEGVDQTLGELLPDHRRLMTPRTASITLHQVLTMTAGLPPDENNDAAGVGAQNWVAAILSNDLAQPPGEDFAYSSAGSHILSAVLAEATGRSVLDYAREKLFSPLGIDTEPAAEPVLHPRNLSRYEAATFAWPVDQQGHHMGYAWLKIAPADMVKIGQLMLAGGEWGGQRVVSRRWVTESTRAHVSTTDRQRRVSDAYAYQWWVTTAAGHHAYAASGFGGQLIEVVPDLDLVVVFSTDIVQPTRVSTEPLISLVDQVIAPAVTR